MCAITQGRRRPDGTEAHEMEPGDYALHVSGETSILWCCSPAGDPGHVTNDRWTITVETDGTVTVSPSIWWNSTETPPGWHGHLAHGVWTHV